MKYMQGLQRESPNLKACIQLLVQSEDLTGQETQTSLWKLSPCKKNKILILSISLTVFPSSKIPESTISMHIVSVYMRKHSRLAN